MPLKIRCPHCRKILVADDEVVGQTKLCPACGQPFNVPIPATEAPPAPIATRKCPRCGAEAAPTVTHCPRCHADLATGRRSPLRQRLRRKGWVYWTGLGVAAAVAGLIGLGVYRLYRIQTQPPPPMIEAPSPQAAAEECVRALLAAETPAALDAAVRTLRLHDAPAVAPVVAAALREALAAGSTSDIDIARQRAAIEILAQSSAADTDRRFAWLEPLERAQREPPLAEAALLARARLGDARVLPEVAAAWRGLLRRELLLERVARYAGSSSDAGTRLALDRTRARRAAHADALRALAADPNVLVYETLADGYWESWQWLGQDEAGLYADALFDLARPGDGATLAFDPRDVRQPRDILVRVAERGTPAARAAAGLVLGRRGPQYRSRCHAICETLRQILPECAPHDQQRLIWTISRLIGKLFLNEAPSHPWDVTYDQVVDALEWADAPGPGVNPGAYARPPAGTYRVITTTSRLEPELLVELGGGWARAESAAERWLAAGLGVTAGLREMLSPAQRRPDHAALANALVIAAEIGDDSLRQILELWQEASDQPAWVRAAAYCALGALDARQGTWRSDWPARLDVGDPAELERGKPGWEYFGRVIAAGGPRMVERLAENSPSTLAPAVYTRLVENARKSLQAREERPGR